LAFTSLGSLGSASLKVAGGTLSFTPSRAVPQGNLVVVWAAWDSDYFFGPDDRQNLKLQCLDDAGNHYASLATAYVASNTETLAALFVAQLEVGLTTSATVRIEHVNNTLVAKAMSAWEFSIASGKRAAWMADNISFLGNFAVDPGPISLAGMPSQAYLLLHLLTDRAPNTATYTWDADYTRITDAGTTGGIDSSNQSIRGGFRIATLTGDTVDITADPPVHQYTQFLTALVEVDDDPFFPTVAVSDDFNRANEDPLATPPWDGTTALPEFGTAKLRVVSNQCAKSASGTGSGSQFWGTVVTGSNVDAFVLLPVLGDADLYIHAAGAGSSSNLVSYVVGCRAIGGGGSDWFGIGHSGFNGSPDLVNGRAAVLWREMTAITALGLQYRNPVMHLWVQTNTVWQWQAALYRTGGSIRTTGKAGIGVNGDAVTRLDDFGVGVAVTPSEPPHLLPILHVGP